jgi:hypothetical protein
MVPAWDVHKEHIVANQLLTVLVNIVGFRPAGRTPADVGNAVGEARPAIRPVIRSAAAPAVSLGSRKGVFRTREYSEAFRNKMLRETELYLTAGLQFDRGEPYGRSM